VEWRGWRVPLLSFQLKVVTEGAGLLFGDALHPLTGYTADLTRKRLATSKQNRPL
jgi:hypothetical protein